MASPLRLKLCDLSVCEGMCCHDGAYLEEGEEAKIREVVASDPAFFSSLSALPGDYILDGDWQGRVSGRKTATQPHAFRRVSLPKHFTATRCVFCLPDARCSLQVLAEARGVHRWTYKPRACWMHPLGESLHGAPQPPPRKPKDDPNNLGASYPGFVSYTHCGRHDPDGLPWEEALAEEIRALQAGGPR